MPLDIFLVERGGELPLDPLTTLEAGEGTYLPNGSTEFISMICLPHDIGGLAMAIARDDILSAVDKQEEIDMPELDELYAGDEVRPEGFRLGWRVYRNKTRRLAVIGKNGKKEDLVLRHRIENLAA